MSERTDTERLEWLLSSGIRIQGGLGTDWIEVDIKFQSLRPKRGGNINQIIRSAIDATMDWSEAK